LGKPLTNLTGKIFGRLTVVERHPENYRGKARWFCQCVCGQKTIVVSGALLSGNTASCGCYGGARTTGKKTGFSVKYSPKHYLYTAYRNAYNRCTNSKDKDFRWYGAVGVKWLFSSFEEFVVEIGERPTPEHTVDRIDPFGHYEPGNVKWATRLEQTLNQRRRKNAA
jgi:hypothetical protein